MAVPPQSFSLDRALFNESLYSSIVDFWFADLPTDAAGFNFPSVKKWYGAGASPKEKEDVDQQCRVSFGPALASIGPEKIALPEFKSYEDDIEKAESLAQPFLKEVTDAQAVGEKAGADTLLALALLLDQMPRNIYRDLAGLRLVYGHYDRLAYALTRASLKLTPNPLELEQYRLRPVRNSWALMPLMHSEHLPSHELLCEFQRKWLSEANAAKNDEAAEYLTKSIDEEKEHLEPLRRFGRYPHRDQCLGRETSSEERDFLKTARSFGVEQNQATSHAGDKSEL